MLRALRGSDLADRAQAWTDRLRASRAPTTPARDLYAGDHWHVVRSLESVAATAGVEVRVWICSAGYGLVPFDAPLRSYAATFSSGHPDSVVSARNHLSPKEMRRQWWSLLSRWEGPTKVARTLADLARQAPDTPLLVAASPPYLDALAADLEAAKSILAKGHLAIFCGGAWATTALLDALVPCDARLQPRFGGARTSLNVRCVRHALGAGDGSIDKLTISNLTRTFSSLLKAEAPAQPAARAAQTDEAVLAYIRAALDAEPGVSATCLLGRLRAAGRACEQSRFGRLFRQMREVPRG